MKFKSLTLGVAMASLLVMTGCATKQQTGMLVGGVVGAAVGGPIGGVAAAHWAAGTAGLIIGAAIGGSIGKHMDEQDQAMARKAVETNTTTTWTNEKTEKSYVVTPKDNGDGTSTVKTEMTDKSGKKVEETTKVKKHIKE